jgi:hypothetical protein
LPTTTTVGALGSIGSAPQQWAAVSTYAWPFFTWTTVPLHSPYPPVSGMSKATTAVCVASAVP